MAYTLTYSIDLGSASTGLTLNAQLVTTEGANTGDAIIIGFTEISDGFYIWHNAAFPDDFRGAVKFYEQGVPGTVLAFISINPEEAEDIAIMVGNIIISVNDLKRLVFG